MDAISRRGIINIECMKSRDVDHDTAHFIYSNTPLHVYDEKNALQ